MPLWTLNKPPRVSNPGGRPPVATKAGWADPDTGELLVAISNLLTKAGAADILAITFDAASYNQGDPFSVVVRFNEPVDVTAGATLVASWDGGSGNITCTALEQLGQHEISFDGTIPAEAGTLSVGAQTVLGTVKDAGTAVDSNLVIGPEDVADLDDIAVA